MNFLPQKNVLGKHSPYFTEDETKNNKYTCIEMLSESFAYTQTATTEQQSVADDPHVVFAHRDNLFLERHR
jgi:hypothetical protein